MNSAVHMPINISVIFGWFTPPPLSFSLLPLLTSPFSLALAGQLTSVTVSLIYRRFVAVALFAYPTGSSLCGHGRHPARGQQLELVR